MIYVCQTLRYVMYLAGRNEYFSLLSQNSSDFSEILVALSTLCFEFRQFFLVLGHLPLCLLLHFLRKTLYVQSSLTSVPFFRRKIRFSTYSRLKALTLLTWHPSLY